MKIRCIHLRRDQTFWSFYLRSLMFWKYQMGYYIDASGKKERLLMWYEDYAEGSYSKNVMADGEE